MISVGLIDEDCFTRECISGSLQGLDRAIEIGSFGSCDDFLRSTVSYDVILYHSAELIAPNLYKTRLTQLAKIAPLVLLSPTDCQELMLKAFEWGSRGFIVTANTTPKQAVEIIHLVNAGGIFVPPSSLDLWAIARPASTPTIIPTCQFTPGELAVLEQLRLGKANKTISLKLRISESTVKVRIKRLMAKLRANNRTEVVCRAYGLPTAVNEMLAVRRRSHYRHRDSGPDAECPLEMHRSHPDRSPR
jgi:DNA-binding NarL/FixJ family response regulator